MKIYNPTYRKRGSYRGKWAENLGRDRFIFEQHEKGRSVRNLASHYGLSKMQIYNILKTAKTHGEAD